MGETKLSCFPKAKYPRSLWPILNSPPYVPYTLNHPWMETSAPRVTHNVTSYHPGSQKYALF